MQSHKGHFIKGSALLVHPLSGLPRWRKILAPGQHRSIVKVGRFSVSAVNVSIKDLAGLLRAGDMRG